MNVHILIAAAAALFLVSPGAAGDAREFGAKGDGTEDDSQAIQKALDTQSAKGGGRVDLGIGHFRLDKPITIPEGVTLAGIWEAPHHGLLSKGTVIEVCAGRGDENGPALIEMNPSSAIKGITFYYPEQRSSQIVPYPWTIRGRGMHCSVIDCTFVNPYRMIDFATYAHELHYIRNIFGSPLKVGISIDKCTDIGRIENVHFNPHYWARAGAVPAPDWNELKRFVQGNLVAFEFARTDWQYVHNTFVWGANVGYRFYESEKGTANGNFLGIAADWCEKAVLVEKCSRSGLLITNGEFVGSNTAKETIDVSTSNTGIVSLSNCSFWGPCGTALRLRGTGTASLSQCIFNSAAYSGPDASYTIDVDGGDLTVQGCRFASDRPDIRLGKDVSSAIIVGNRFVKSKEIENLSNEDVQEGLNVVVKQ